MWKPGDPTLWPDREVHGLARLRSVRTDRPLPSPPTTHGFVTNVETEYLRPVCVGDHLSSGGQKLVSVAVKETSVGFGAFTVSESYVYNQRGEVVAIRRNGGYRYNPHSPEKLEEMWRQRREGRESEAELGSQREEERPTPPASRPRSDWNESLHWEQVKEGDPVPPVSLNLTVQRLVMIAGAIRNFDFMHHDTVLTRRSGAEEMYLASTGIQAVLERTLREYIGTQGVIRKIGPLRYGIFNEAGFTMTTKGVVKKKYQQDEQNFVELQMWSENDRGVSVGPGPVVVALPGNGSS